MIHRFITTTLLERLGQFPVVGIIGPRQAGKTTLARSILSHFAPNVIYLDLELYSDFAKLQQPELFLTQQQEKLVILDEIQRMPSLFPLLRALVDQKRIPGRFLILGSASPRLITEASESLAGRIYYLELSPFHLKEVFPQYAMEQHWFRGGFPDAFLASDDQGAKYWLDGFIRSYVERDLPMLGLAVAPVLLRRFWTMLAHFHGGIWNASSFSKSLGLSVPTVNKYLDFLEGAFLIRRLQPFYPNVKKRLVKSPKIYLCDSGILHRLTNIINFDHLQGQILLGPSWEGYVIEQIFNLIGPGSDIELCFYRTQSGSEMDLVLVKGGRPIAVAEIKYTDSPSTQKGMTESIKDLNAAQNFIITPKSDDYLIHPGLRVCSLWRFLNQYLPSL